MNDAEQLHLERGARLRGVIAKLSRQLNSSAAVEGLTPSQASVLGLIAFRGPLRLSELAALEGLNPTMVSRIVGKLDDDRLIRRVKNEDDLRSASVEITEYGVEVHEQIKAERARVVTECLNKLPVQSIEAILAALPALDLLADELIGQRSGPRPVR